MSKLKLPGTGTVDSLNSDFENPICKPLECQVISGRYLRDKSMSKRSIQVAK